MTTLGGEIMRNVYIELVLGHPSFHTGKICIVELHDDYEFIETYVEPAKRKACEKLGLNKNEVAILNWSFLGEDVAFIK